MTVEWARPGAPLAPTRPGGFDDTPVGRLPTGPAGDAALAAATGAPAGPPAAAAAAEPPPPPSRSRRAVVRRTAVAAGAAALAAALAGFALVRARRGR